MGQRQAAQCVGRVIRSKADYGMMIFADKRYAGHPCPNSHQCFLDGQPSNTVGVCLLVVSE
jgi:hypothetical protein